MDNIKQYVPIKTYRIRKYILGSYNFPKISIAWDIKLNLLFQNVILVPAIELNCIIIKLI